LYWSTCVRTPNGERFASLYEGVGSKIFDVLPDETWVYPGHGKDTTLGDESRTWRSGGNGAGKECSVPTGRPAPLVGGYVAASRICVAPLSAGIGGHEVARSAVSASEMRRFPRSWNVGTGRPCRRTALDAEQETDHGP